ncbi:MAG: hypothetical protein G3M70_15630 [Candidatus Nitronauta litoralis]|uniref:Uncharacterized protein n=1 Tax=Candidatus Nitronauta litoralis TaxID=2705533 RepID=A0A7T0G1T5_9BACT|nr:MAG: hypothetical protein G3M70_15630 [Candidatus Nitronauta litoralis]
MAKRQLSFFATRNDLSKVLEVVASRTLFCFASYMDDQEGFPKIYRSILDLPNLSVSVNGELNRENSYLLIENGVTPKIRHIEQRRGGTRKLFDQLSHPESVLLKPGGVMGEFECIIAGQIGTVSDNQWSGDLYKDLLREFKKRFKKVKAFYVGSSAMEKLEAGVRLTSNVKSPPEYDLSL